MWLDVHNTIGCSRDRLCCRCVLRYRCTTLFYSYPSIGVLNTLLPKSDFGEEQNCHIPDEKIPWGLGTQREPSCKNKKGLFPMILGQRSPVVRKLLLQTKNAHLYRMHASVLYCTVLYCTVLYCPTLLVRVRVYSVCEHDCGNY